ncbi:MAG: restriction endonuclease subunit S [Planctomycetaceae bacterium]|nr:restriction endonuclease subunit S [Planctomycetaceae bacterium]
MTAPGSLNLATEWRLLSLREAGVSLLDCDHRTPRPASEGYPYIAIPQVKNGRLDLSDVRRISHEDFLSWTRRTKPQGHDVVLSRRCNPGETALVPLGLECALGQNLVLLRSDGTKIFPPFLRWLLRGKEWWDQVGTFINVGAVFDSLKCADIPNFQLMIPPLAEQRRIAGILDSLDDKIELNRRTNETLEAMARALFQSWFVDFDPVHAKAAVHRHHPTWSNTQVSRAALPNLNPEIAELFPDRFEESALGPIPFGWKCRGLRDIAEIQSGGTPRRGNDGFWNGTIPWITPKAMMGIHVDTSDELVTEAAIGNGTRLVPQGTTLVMVRGMGLHQGVRISQAQRDVAFNQDVKAIIPRDVPAALVFFGLLAAAPRLFEKVHAAGHGTGVLATEFLEGLDFAFPPDNVGHCFAESLDALNDRMKLNDQDTKELIAARDTLLPQLLSGELSAVGACPVV